MTSIPQRAFGRRAVVLAAAIVALGCARQCSGDGEAERPMPETTSKTRRAASPDAGTAPDDGRPAAIVLVVVDTLRADFLPFYGHSPDTAPFLEKMLADAVIFDNAYAPSSWTVPSMASLHTGLYPSTHGAVAGGINIDKGRTTFLQPVLPQEVTTLAESIRGAGYRTIGVVANQHLGPTLGFAQGFDTYNPDVRFDNARRLNRVIEGLLSQSCGESWSSRWRRTKTFLWLHYFDPHEPYAPRIPWTRVFAPDFFEHPEAYPANMLIAHIKKKFRPNAEFKAKAAPLYESEIAFWDDQFHRLSREASLDSDDVLLVFTSDHGEEFAEHGDMGHGNGLYEEVVHVPLAIRWPHGGFRAPRRVSAPVSLVDLFPTIAEIAKAAVPPRLPGRSLVPILRGADGDAERPLYMELKPPNPDTTAWRQGRYKLIRRADTSRGGGRGDALFDLQSDPQESKDIARTRPDVARRLGTQLDAFVRSLPPPPSKEVKVIEDEQLLQQLINMDYVRGNAAQATIPGDFAE
jgi:arylsulfatase A-like enzyme